MAKTKISEYSATASNNTDINGIDIAEGCAPSGINNAIRELMAQLKDQQTGTDADNFTVGGNLSVTGTTTATGTITATTINTSGNVGIGTSSPTGLFAKVLQVGSTSSGSIKKVYVAGEYNFEGAYLGNSSSNGGAALELVSHIASGTSTSWKIEHNYDVTADDLVFSFAPTSSTYGGLTYAPKMTLDFNGILTTYGQAAYIASGIGAGDATIEIAPARTVDGLSLIDFHSSVGTDYDFRILRASGVNNSVNFYNAGTGGMYFYTNGVQRAAIDSAGITGNLAPNFTGSNQSLAASGYQKLPGGLIMQWGTISSLGDNVSETITFPLAFPTAAVSFVATAEGTSAFSDVAYIFRSLTTTNVIVTQMYNSSNVGGRYMAIGY